MANAGFRSIDNDTFKALIATRLPGAGYQVVLVIIDRTMGFRKGSGYKEKARIPLRYFQQVTGLSRQSVRLAIKEAEKRQIIMVERDSTRASTYALNLDTGKWLTRKPNHPNKLGNKITPNWETKSPQTRKLAIASCMPAKETFKETFKETLKERGYDKERDTVSYQSDVTDTSSTLPLPHFKEINELTVKSNELALKERTLTHGDTIEAFLQSHGMASIKAISQATGITPNSVNTILHLAKGKRFQHLPEKRAWCVAEKYSIPVMAKVNSSVTKCQDYTTTRKAKVDAYLKANGTSRPSDIARAIGVETKRVHKFFDRQKAFYENPEYGFWKLKNVNVNSGSTTEAMLTSPFTTENNQDTISIERR